MILALLDLVFYVSFYWTEILQAEYLNSLVTTFSNESWHGQKLFAKSKISESRQIQLLSIIIEISKEAMHSNAMFCLSVFFVLFMKMPATELINIHKLNLKLCFNLRQAPNVRDWL